MIRPLAIFVLVAGSVLVAGCQEMTEAQQKEAAEAKAAQETATVEARAALLSFQALNKEFQEIRAKVEAGEDLVPAAASRFVQLQRLVPEAWGDVLRTATALEKAKEAYDRARAAGVAWYNRVSWKSLGLGAVAVLGVASTIAAKLLPKYAALLAALRAVIEGVSNVNKLEPTTVMNVAGAGGNTPVGQAVKDAVQERARALGIENVLNTLVQRFDPPTDGREGAR